MSLDRTEIWSRNPERRETFAKRIREDLDINVETADTAEKCVRGMRVVITVTKAPKHF